MIQARSTDDLWISYYVTIRKSLMHVVLIREWTEWYHIAHHVNGGCCTICQVESNKAMSQGFFKLTELEKEKGSRIVTIISSASTDDSIQKRDDKINNSSVEDKELRACDDINTIKLMAEKTQSTYTYKTWQIQWSLQHCQVLLKRVHSLEPCFCALLVARQAVVQLLTAICALSVNQNISC